MAVGVTTGGVGGVVSMGLQGSGQEAAGTDARAGAPGHIQAQPQAVPWVPVCCMLRLEHCDCPVRGGAATPTGAADGRWRRPAWAGRCRRARYMCTASSSTKRKSGGERFDCIRPHRLWFFEATARGTHPGARAQPQVGRPVRRAGVRRPENGFVIRWV